MKRVKTKQELNLSYRWGPEYRYAYGLPFDKLKQYHKSTFGDYELTTDPHPYDSMDIKVRVTPEQTKKLQEKAFAMGCKWAFEKPNTFWDLDCEIHDSVLICADGRKELLNGDSTYVATELTFKQFMNGSVPKKKAPKILLPKQEEKIFTIGQYYKSDATIIKCTGTGIADYPSFAGIVIECNENTILAIGEKSSTWNADVFELVPDYVKASKFKVGDLVKIVDLGKNSTDAYRIGARGENEMYLKSIGAEYFFCTDRVKHTVKLIEQPLEFNGHEVKIFENYIAIGCFNADEKGLIPKDCIKDFMEFCKRFEWHAAPNEMYDFIKANKEKLNL